jgi:peptide/nickel transport system substrate-binding protein
MKPKTRDERIRDERVLEAYEQYRQNKITRRDFLRFASVMGASLAALGLSACTQPTQEAAPPPTAQVIENTVVVEKPVEVTKVVEKLITPTPVPTPMGGIIRGGNLNSNFFYSTERFNDPAIISNYFVSNTLRQVAEYMVYVDPAMIVRPALATKWTPSADGKTWDIELRQGVKFNHGKDFNADDVVFTFERLLDPNTASGFTGIANYLKPGSVEKVDDYNVKFHAERAVGDFPYHLYAYMAAVLPADWGGDFYEQPWGTGPFKIKEFRPDERIVFEARDDYWDVGLDGKPLPYIDTLEIRNYPDDASYLDALSNGDIHLTGISTALMPEIIKMDKIRPNYYQSGGFFNGVIHVNEKPFDDVRVRQALKIAVDRAKWVNSVYVGYAIPGNDTPLAPIYADAPDIPPTAQDIEKAKALLTEAGYPDGLDITAHFINDELTTNTATWLAASAEEAGFRIKLEPNPEYWQVWLDDWGPNKIGVSNWGMRSTPSEYFNIAYQSSAAWNETHWKNETFDSKLAAYDASVDAAERKQLLNELSTLIKEDGGLLTAGHYQVLYANDVKLNGFELNPVGFTNYARAWFSE